MQNHDHTATEASADADLILRTRSGDADAFGELWRRHYPSGISVARSITSSLDPDDLVQEAYTRIYQAIIKGGGPNGSFRAYLFTSIRNTAAAWGRSRRETAMDELETIADPDSTEQAADEALDRSLTAQAFRGLPSRWQEVLWYTEIEQMKPAEVAPLLGMKAGAVSQLAFRAREGLREAWIQAHLKSAEPGSECQWTIEHLGAYSRGNLSARDQKRLDQHIENCARCMIVVAEAKGVSDRLALVLLPLVLGVAGAAGYTATLQAGGAPIVALAAMPSSVIEGGVVVSGGTSGAVGVFAGDSGGTIGSGTGGTGAAGGSSPGTVTGIGALVGVGSAALVVASVVAATTIVPGLLEANPMTSLPSASVAGESSISSELEPDTEMNDEKFILEIREKNPKTPDDVDEAPEVKVPVVDDTPTTEVAPPVVAVTPTAPDAGSGADGDAGTTEPVDPAEPGTGEPIPGDGGDVGEGDGDDPPDQGGGEDPEPTAPTEQATVTGVDWIDRDPPLRDNHTVTIHVSGLPQSKLEAVIVKQSGSGNPVSFDLDSNGEGKVVLEATQNDLSVPNSVKIQYLGENGPLFPFSTTFRELHDRATGTPDTTETPDPAEDQADAEEPAADEPVTSEQGPADATVAETPSESPATNTSIDENVSEAVPAPADETVSPAGNTVLEDIVRLTAPTEDTTPAE